MTDTISSTIDLYGDDEQSVDYDQPAEPIHPADPGRLSIANWHLRKLGYLDTVEADTRRAFDAEIQLLEQRRNDALRTIARRQSWHTEALAGLHGAMLAEDPKRKTIVLPSGTLKATVPKTARLYVTDPDVFVAWAEAHGRKDLLRVTTVPARDDINRAVDLRPQSMPSPGSAERVVDASGELVPGLEAQLGLPSFRAHAGEQPGPALDLAG